MHVALSILLGAVFVLSAVTKLIDPPAWVAQARELGVPAGIAGAVPWFELAVGASVAAGVIEPVPASVALALLVAFTAVIVVNLAAGRRPPCACFGRLSAAPISWRHVARNAVFAALAAAVIAT